MNVKFISNTHWHSGCKCQLTYAFPSHLRLLRKYGSSGNWTFPYEWNQKKIRPHRLGRPRTPGFHPGNRGSNPLGDALFFELFVCTQYLTHFKMGDSLLLEKEVIHEASVY